MDTNTIKIINSSFQFLGDIEDYISFYFVRNFTKAKEFQIVAPIKYINILKDDNIIFISPKKAGIIEEVSIDESKKIITAKGRDLKSVLCRRITVPPIGKVHDEIKSNVESVIKHYVINNCINPVDSKRKMLQLKINPNKNRGKTIAWQSRFKVLDLELEQICNCVGIGFEVYIDLEKKKFIFDIIEGRDRSGGNSTVIFSEEFDNITDSTHTNNSLSYRTMGYVASQDEEQDIGIKEVFKDNATGLERRELFIDATDIEEDDKLGDKAKSKLAEYDYITSNESTVINSNFQYEKDWNLGDIVLLKNTLGKSAQRVVEVTEIYEGNRKIEIVLGSVIPLFTEKITNEISNISSSVSNEKPSKIWRPSIDNDGNLIWNLNSSLDTPDMKNIKGPKGDKGDQGVRGSKGDKGDTGATGSTGPQGIQGTKGEGGATGPKGNNGITPIIGSNGNWFLETTDTGKPSRGIQGDKGDKINHRWSGTILKLENPDGSFDSGVNLKGDKGDRGSKGLKGDTGERGPQGVQGPAGDGQSYVVFQKYFTATEGQKNFTWNDGYVYPVGINAIAVYINGMRIGNKAFIETSGNSITTKRALINGEIVFIEAMQAVKDLQGPRGPQGVQGPKGDKGETGERGLKGDKGDTGAIGPRGSQGSQGIQGPKGDQGLIGSKGNNGITPTIGRNGNWFLGSTDTRKPSRGIQGPRGIQGIQGPKGDKGNTGSVGPRGATGSRGLQGLQGLQGPRGNTGPPGKDGTQIITSKAQPSGHIRGRVWIQTL
ncbi:Gp37-like protein [Clostridium oceanicum]|uniref:Gp28/Gp37-like domain-containing protein n=1 Tax=Clostridium oceanicum TaxID=1543 RepID=A0ABP3UII7_9CLOT